MSAPRRPIAPAPTEDEVLTVLKNNSGTALSASAIGARIWWARGGDGNPYDPDNDDETPRVTPYRMQPLLDEMAGEGTILIISMNQNYLARGMVDQPSRLHKGTVYYGMPEEVIAARQTAEQRAAMRDRAMLTVQQFRERFGDVITSANTTAAGEVEITLTVEQLRELFEMPDPEAPDQ